MKRIVLYKYLGTNGEIISPVHLEDIYYVRLIKLIADNNKTLTNGKIRRLVVTVPEEEEKDWKEIDRD